MDAPFLSMPYAARESYSQVYCLSTQIEYLRIGGDKVQDYSLSLHLARIAQRRSCAPSRPTLAADAGAMRDRPELHPYKWHNLQAIDLELRDREGEWVDGSRRSRRCQAVR